MWHSCQTWRRKHNVLGLFCWIQSWWQHRYHSILQHHAKPSGMHLVGHGFVFQQDNYPKHTYKQTPSRWFGMNWTEGWKQSNLQVQHICGNFCAGKTFRTILSCPQPRPGRIPVCLFQIQSSILFLHSLPVTQLPCGSFPHQHHSSQTPDCHPLLASLMNQRPHVLPFRDQFLFSGLLLLLTLVPIYLEIAAPYPPLLLLVPRSTIHQLPHFNHPPCQQRVSTQPESCVCVVRLGPPGQP